MANINYYDQEGKLKNIDFDHVFNQWIELNGGNAEVTKVTQRLSEIELESLSTGFLVFFMQKYKCSLPEENDSMIYRQRLNRVVYEQNTRPTSRYNIAFLVLVALALLGFIM